MTEASACRTAARMSHLGELSAAAAKTGGQFPSWTAQEKTPHFLLQGAPRAADSPPGHIPSPTGTVPDP